MRSTRLPISARTMKPQCTREEISKGLVLVGLKRGDVVFSHGYVGQDGYLQSGYNTDIMFQSVWGAFQDVIGKEGTLVVPTFTYSFCRREQFDPDHTPSRCGMFTEMLRLRPDARRSRDPIFSVVAIGRLANELTSNVPAECFGKNSCWERFLQAKGVFCSLKFNHLSSFTRYVERCLNVPYRYDRVFTGVLKSQGQLKKGVAINFCRDFSSPNTKASVECLEELTRKRNLVRGVSVGHDVIKFIRATDVYDLIKDELKTNPWLLTVSAKTEKSSDTILPAETTRFRISLNDNASMKQMIMGLWWLPRDLISDGYDVALEALSKQVPMTIHQYPTGTRCFTWIIPEKWTCYEAYLETLGGKQLFSYADNPLHVISYSLSFEGEVSRNELFDHLHVHPKIAEATPFEFKYYEHDWGLCCSKNLKDSLTDDNYRVRIKTNWSYGTLKVGEVVASGESEKSIILCAHLCHPAMVNDDLSGVVVGIEIMRRLLARPNLRYTYRLLILPETIGSAGYLSHNEHLIPKMKGGFFLDMLGTNHPHSLQHSLFKESEIDRCCELIVLSKDKHAWVDDYARIVLNDERMFNAPGIKIPMVSISRTLPKSHPDTPYREYHSSFDTPDRTNFSNMEKSRDLVLDIIEMLEKNRTPQPRFKGEIFCSRFSRIDYNKMFDLVQDVSCRIDGQKDIADLSHETGIEFHRVSRFLDILEQEELIEWKNSR